MKPIKFKEVNKELQRPRDMLMTNCKSLPILNTDGLCISCWKMSFRERVAVLLFGKLWLTVRSGETQPPVKLTIDKPFY